LPCPHPTFTHTCAAVPIQPHPRPLPPQDFPGLGALPCLDPTQDYPGRRHTFPSPCHLLPAHPPPHPSIGTHPLDPAHCHLLLNIWYAFYYPHIYYMQTVATHTRTDQFPADPHGSHTSPAPEPGLTPTYPRGGTMPTHPFPQPLAVPTFYRPSLLTGTHSTHTIVLHATPSLHDSHTPYIPSSLHSFLCPTSHLCTATHHTLYHTTPHHHHSTTSSSLLGSTPVHTGTWALPHTHAHIHTHTHTPTFTTFLPHTHLHDYYFPHTTYTPHTPLHPTP